MLGLVVALLAAAFFVASRDPLYGWFGASILCSTLGGLNLHVRDPPMSTQAWARLVQMAVAVSPLLFVPFAHRLAGVRRPRIERAVTAAAGAVVLLAVVVPPASFLPVFTALHLPALVVGLSVLGAHLWRSSRAERVVFSATAGLLLAFAAHDIAVQFGERQGAPRYANPLGMPVLFVTFGGLVTLRFVRVFRRAERQNEELEERVREKHAELEAQFERLHLLEQERAIGQERERMMREMHDGLGGRLVEALSLAEDAEASRDEIAGSLRGSLDEMRLLVDSLDPLTDDLAVLLASIRERLEPGLRRRGIELRWEVEALRDLAHLGPSERLHVLRIVQEAFTNVLKHADASRVTLRASRAGDSVRIEVADDGRGVGPEPRGGRGLDNMRKRALALGGSLSVERSGGTVVRLALPA